MRFTGKLDRPRTHRHWGLFAVGGSNNQKRKMVAVSLEAATIRTGVKTDVIDSIGNTPLVEVTRLSPDPAIRIFAKLESGNQTRMNS